MDNKNDDSFVTTDKNYDKSIEKNTYRQNDYTMNLPEGYPHKPKEIPEKIDHANPN